MEYQRNQQASQKMAMMQLELLAVPARDSDQASYAALQKYPGYVLGPVRKLSQRE